MTPCDPHPPLGTFPRPVAFVLSGGSSLGAMQVGMPCSVTAAPAQAASSPVVRRLMSLMAHLVFGATLGLLYRPKADTAGREGVNPMASASRKGTVRVS